MNNTYLIILFSLLFSQSEITTQQFNFFKTNEIKNINFSDIIDNINGEYIVKLISIKEPDFKRTKRILIEPCDLEFTLKNTYDTIQVSRCEGQYNFDGTILISEEDYTISIYYPKYDYLNCTFIFWVSGNYIYVSDDNNLKKDGILNEYHENGLLKIEYTFQDGKKDGIQKRWYQNGQLEIIYNYNMGKLEGLQKKWHQNGILKGEWNYSDDKLNGIVKEWYPNKQLKFSKKYIFGELVELIEHYNPDGSIVQ